MESSIERKNIIILTLILVTVLTMYVFFYTSPKNSGLSNIPNSVITIGNFNEETVNISTTQADVDLGHQPWRLDPASVLISEGIQKGFTQSELETSQLVFQALSAGVYQYEVIHGGITYIVTVEQPVPGQAQIWRLSSIQKK